MIANYPANPANPSILIILIQTIRLADTVCGP